MKTVVIETENGPVIINKSDYDPKIHKLVGEKKPQQKSNKKVNRNGQ